MRSIIFWCSSSDASTSSVIHISLLLVASILPSLTSFTHGHYGDTKSISASYKRLSGILAAQTIRPLLTADAHDLYDIG